MTQRGKMTVGVFPRLGGHTGTHVFQDISGLDEEEGERSQMKGPEVP